MWARFTVLNETPSASAIAGCVIPLSRSSTIWMRSRCAAGIFHRSAVFNCRICFLVHLTIRPPESDSQSESYRTPSREPEKRQKSLDSNSYGSGIRDNFKTAGDRVKDQLIVAKSLVIEAFDELAGQIDVITDMQKPFLRLRGLRRHIRHHLPPGGAHTALARCDRPHRSAA